MTQTRDLIKKMADFFTGEEFYEKGEDARLELSPDDVRCMNYLIKQRNKTLEQEPITKNDLAHNLCDSCTNFGCEFQSGIVRTKCAFYMPPHIEPDNCGNYVVMQLIAEVISKDQYETRLKADMVAILDKIRVEIADLEEGISSYHNDRPWVFKDEVLQIIDKHKEETEG